MSTAGRLTLFIAICLSLSSWDHSKFGANGQAVTITGIFLATDSNAFILERTTTSSYSIASVSGATSAAGGTITGADLWELDVFLTTGLRQNPDLSPGAKIQAIANPTPTIISNPAPGEVLRFDNVQVMFDLTSVTCASVDLICVNILMNSAANPAFQLVQANAPGCIEIVCRGVVVDQVEPLLINRNNLVQGAASNVLELVIQLTANSMYGSVQGTRLTEVEVFGNLQPDGRGEKYPAIYTPSTAVHGIQDNGVSVLPQVTATLNLLSVGCNQLSYVCVDVRKAPNPVPPYTLEFQPPEASVACREISCTGLIVTGGSFTSSPLGEYKASHSVTIQTITFSSDSNGGSVAANAGGLWSIEIAVADGTMTVLEESRTIAVIPPGQDGRGFTAGGMLTFSGITATMNLSPYECSEMQYVVVRLLKNDNSPVDFTFNGGILFESAACIGLTITSARVSQSSVTSNGFPLQELTDGQQMVFDVTFGTDQRYGSVRGSDLWVLQVAISNAPSPDITTLSPATATLTTAQRNLDVEGGNNLSFLGTTVTLSYTDGICDTTKYFCVAISKDTNRAIQNGMDFQLDGIGVGCVPVQCVGISITDISIGASPLIVSEHSMQVFTIDATVGLDPDAGSARGVDLWTMRVVLNRDQNLDLSTFSNFPAVGEVPDLVEQTDFLAGQTTEFSLTSDIFLGAACEDLQYICLVIQQNPSAIGRFTYDPARNVQFGCTALDFPNCRDVVIQALPVTILGGEPLRENEPAGQIITVEFGALAAPNSIMMSTSGSNYWQLVVFGSQSPMGDGDRVAVDSSIGLSAAQRATALSSGDLSPFGSVTYNLLTNGVDCSRISHVCVELMKNTQVPLPSPDFTLQSSAVGCAAVDCTGVQIESTTVSVQSGGFREGAMQNDLIVTVTMSATAGSAGVSGENLWSLYLFSNNQADGNGPVQRVRTVLPMAVTWSGTSLTNRQAVLSNVDLSSYFDLTSILCAEVPFVCLTVSQGPSPSTPFTLTETVIGSSLTGCVSVPCDGFTVIAQGLILTPPLAIAIEHSQNPVAARFSASFVSTSQEAIVGASLWHLDVFLNDQMNGNGNQQMTRVTQENFGPEGVQRLNPGQTVTFDNVLANIPVDNFVCPLGQTYLCVQLQKNPQRSFTLLPADPICEPIECRGLRIDSVSINQLTGNPFVELALNHAVNLEVTINTDGDWAGVIGERLWSYTIYLSPTDDHSLNRHGMDSGRYTLATEEVIAGQPFVSQVNTILDLSNVLCQSAAFLCLIVDKGVGPSVTYTFEEREESRRRDCRPIGCQGVDLVSLGPNIISGEPFLERNPSQMLQVTLSLSFSQTSASVQGSRLWDVTFFTNSNSAGTGSRAISASFMDREGNVQQGDVTTLENFVLDFDLSNTGTICADIRYLCAQVSKSTNAAPDFRLNPSQLVQCIPVDCRGTIIEDLTVRIISPGSLLEVLENPVRGDVTYQARAGYASLSDVSGQDIWGYTLFTNSFMDGSGQREVQTTIHGPGSIIADGVPVSLSLLFELDLFNYVCNSGPDYLCLEVGPGQHFNLAWDVTYPDPVCSEIPCFGARFDVLLVDLGTSVLVEYDPSHIFTFDLSANTAVGTTTIENRNNALSQAISDVWQVSLLGDVRMCLQQPGSEFYLEAMATLTAEQTMSPFIGGETFEILDIRADLNLSSFSCPEEEYHLCVTLGKNPNSVPAFTLENDASDPTQCQASVLTVCQLVTCVGVVVETTDVVIDGSQFVREREFGENVAFDLVVTSSPDGSAAQGDLLWSITTYVSLANDGSGERYGATTATLSAEQVGLDIAPGATVTFGNIVATMNLQAFSACPVAPAVLYFCAVLEKDSNPSRPFRLGGQLLGCVQIDCRGVVIISRIGTSDPNSILKEGTGESDIRIDVEYFADINGASVEGTDLWEIEVYANGDPEGRGVHFGETLGQLPINGGNFPLRAGQRTVFAPVSATLSLTNAFAEYRTCAEIQHVCGLLQRRPTSPVSFTLEAQPAFANTACARFECSGVIISDTQLMPLTTLDVVEGSRSFTVDFDLLMSVHSSSSTLLTVGQNHWRVVVFGNSNSNGLGQRTAEVEFVVSSPLDSRGATPNSVTSLNDLQATLDFRGEFCNTLQFICAQVSVPANSIPLFRLDGFSNEPERLIGCQPTSCIGVRVVGGTITVPTSTSLIEGLQNHMLERVDVIFNTDSSGAGAAASGEDLWTIQVFLASDLRGGNPYSVTQATVPGSAASQTLIAGQSLNFASTSAVIDTRTLSCSSDPYICATLGAHPSRVFSLNGYIPQTNTFDDDLLTVCTRINCDGVVIEQNVITIIEPAGSIFAREDNNFCLDVTLSFAADGGSVVGTDLFEFEAYMSQNANGDLPVTDSVTAISLRADQTAIDAINGQSATFDTLKTNLSLGLFNCPSGVGYVCVRVREGPNSNPSYTLSGQVVSCAEINCIGITVESSSLSLISPPSVVENSDEQIASFDFTLAVAPGSAGFRLQERLWLRFRVYTANSQGNPVGNLDAFTLLSFDQASTVLTSGEVSVIAGVGVSPFDTFNTLCRDIPMFCVTLEEDPDYSVVFLNGAETACVPISCRGVEVLDVNILSNGPEVREREPTFILTEFRAEVESDPDGASVTGSNLWNVAVFFDDQADCLGNAFPGTRTTDGSLSNLPVRAGQTLLLTRPFFVMNLQNLACPSGPLYLCVEFDKQEITTPPFTLSFPNGVNSRYGSVEARCRGVEIFTSLLSSIPDGVIVQEGDTSRNLVLNFFSSFTSTTASLQGTNLWELTVFGSRTADGTVNREFPTKVFITEQNLRDQSVPRFFLAFDEISVTVNLRGTRCANFQYICVTIDRDPGSDPFFTLIGAPDDSNAPEVVARTACIDVTCAGVEVVAVIVGISQGVVIFENNPTQEIQGSVGIQTHPEAAPVTGNNYWRVFVFFNDRPDGYGPAGRLLETEMNIPPESRTQDLPPGGEIQFNPAQATVNFNTSCSIGEYMCFEIFNGLDILSPQVTLLGNVIHCFDVPCQGLQVSQTSLAIQNGLTFLEGETAHNIFFDVEVSSSSLGADGPAVPTWQVRAFLSSADNSNGIINDTIVTSTIIENVLTPPLQAQQFFAGTSVQFSNVQASFSVEGLLCETTRFLCVEFGVVEGSAHSVAPVDGEANRLVDCQALSCTGVVVSSTSLELRNGEPLVSNQRNQELILTFEFRTALNSISVSGQGLYSIEIFPNNATDGQGTTPLDTRTTFNQRQVTSIVANTFSSVESFRITIALEGIRCDQMPFICGTLMRGPSPSPPYTLQPDAGDPILTACTRMLDCVGVIITQFDVAVDPTSLPIPEDAISHLISSQITIASSSDGASVNALNVWAVSVFMSASADGSGVRFFETAANIGGTAGEPLPAGGTLGPFASNAFLSLDGFSCANTQYLCHEFTKTAVVDPDFTLEAAPFLPNGLVNCRQFLCRAVEFDSVTFFIDRNQGSSSTPFRAFEFSPSFEFSLDIRVMTGSGSVAVSGSDLWKVTAFFSAQADGTGTRQGETVASLTTAQGEVLIIPGEISQLDNVIATSDLTGVRCQNIQYLCIEVWKGDNSDPEYGIDVPASQADLRQCLPVACAGVEILSVTPALPAGSPALIDRSPVDQPLTFDLTVEASDLAGGIQGSSLWAVEAYIAADDNVFSSSHQRISPVAATVPSSEANKPLVTTEPLSLLGIVAAFDLGSAGCSDVLYLCATIQEAVNANPNFNIINANQGNSLTGCVQVQCANAAILRTTMEHGPPSTLEGDPSHTILMNITAEASDFGMAIFQNSIWQFTVTVTPGNPANTMVPVVIDSGLTTTQQNTDFIPGATIRFTNVQATVNLQGLTCLEVEFFCVRINLVQSLQLVGVPDESSLQACSPVISCGEFEVSINVVSYNERTITISWGGGVGDFDRYQITYSPETGSTQSPLIIERFGQRTLVFEDLTPGELYTITIQLLKGSLSKDGMRTVTQRTRPEQVRGLTIQDVNSQSIQVSWEDAGGSFDSYVVTLDPMDGFPASPFLRVPGDTQVTFNNLVIATRYEATVITRSGNEDSLVSRANGLTTPTPPTLRVQETTSDQIAVSWSPPAGYIPSRYQLSWNATTSFVDLINITNVDVRSRDITGLIPATRYDINLRAVVDRSGTTASSPPSVAIGVTAPDVPVIDNVVVNATSITLSLSLPRGIADSYELQYRPLSTISRTVLTIEYQTTVRYMVSDLQSATLYSFEVISQFQNLVSNRVSMEIRTVIEGPSNLEITNVDSTSISFRWVEATGKRDSYLVSAYYPNINNSLVVAIDGNSHTFDNLPPYTTIDISVQTVFVQDGIEIRSNPLTRSQRTSGDIPGPVRNVKAMQVLTDTKIAIEFEVPDMVNGDLEEFIVTYTESRENAVLSTTTSTIMVVSTAVVFYTKSFTNNINRGSSYVFSITARNNFGDGPSVDTDIVVINNIIPNFNLLISEAVVSEAPTENQLTVTFDRNLVSTDSGDIQDYTVIIAERGQFLEDIESIDPLESSDDNPSGPYQAFAPRPWPTNGNIQVVLGEDDICGSFTYCNPPLREGTTYLVAIRVYNDVGYRTSDFMEFTTSESFFSQNQIYFYVGGIIVVAILFIVLALCLVCCVVRNNKSSRDLKPRRRKRVSSSVSDDSGDGLDNINLNNAVTMIYNPAERASSGPSIASRFDNGAGVITRPVRIQNFASHVGKLSLNNQEGFEEEFESLHNSGLGQPSTAAVTTWNKSKNRFSNILPYDTSRVVLHGSDDFINASFIQGFHRPHEFIATQGPMEHTVNDFWRMVWEQQVPIVVMICDIIEGGKAKCEEYWPPLGEPTAFGEIVVTTLSEKQTTKGREREFKLEIGEHSLSVTHYQFLEWPDKGVPTETASFMLFVKDIRSHMQTLSGPVVVHCSDGASRTGVFIALDVMMQALDNGSDTLDVYGVVARLRKDRTNMVLSKHYYVFIHQAILDVLLAQVSDSNWTFGSSDTPTRYSYIPLDDTNGLLARESRL